MKILKNEGTFEVLSKTDDVIHQIASAARTCYKSFDKQLPESDLKLVKNLLNRGHFAMIEFGDMTVKFTKVSRGVTHELVRHRIASFAQESTRYVNESDLHVVVPPHKELSFGGWEYPSSDCKIMNMDDWFESVEGMYKILIDKGWKPEDARQVLPIATEAPIVMKANLREWRQVFKMRCDYFAHWEIRKVMLDLLRWCKENIPLIFDDYHFFKTESGQEYARPVTPENVLKDQIKHYLIAKLDVNGLCESESLVNYVKKIESEILEGIYDFDKIKEKD